MKGPMMSHEAFCKTLAKTAEEVARLSRMVDEDSQSLGPLPEHLRWKGDGPEPASWFAPDGTKVYRSYADYVMD